MLRFIEEKVSPDSIAYANTFKACHALEITESITCIKLSKLFADRGESRHLRKFNDINKDSFLWFLKEYKWLFNGGYNQWLYKEFKH